MAAVLKTAGRKPRGFESLPLRQSNRISFERPAAWTRSQPNQHSPITGGPLIYLSTDPLSAACAVTPVATPNPPDSQGRACDWPLKALAPNGVLVSWINNRILAPLPT